VAVDRIVTVVANVIVAALGNGNDIVCVVDLPCTRCGRQMGLAESWSQLISG
jgi:hypothetical protein